MRTSFFSILSGGAALVLAVALPNGVLGADNQATAGAVTAGTVSSTVEGREIRARSKAPVTINTVGGKASVNIGSHVLLVGKDQLQLDEGMPSSLPAATKLLEIDVVDEMIVVLADGKEVLRAKMDDNKQE